MIGCNNITNPSGEQDCEARVFQQVVTHPRHYEPVRDWLTDLHDCALVKIYDASRIGSFIRINEDPYVPDSVRDESLTILGWGITNHSDRDSASDVLREASVNYIPNDECKQIRGPAFSLTNRVFDTSLCAADFENGADSVLVIAAVPSQGQDGMQKRMSSLESRLGVPLNVDIQSIRLCTHGFHISTIGSERLFADCH